MEGAGVVVATVGGDGAGGAVGVPPAPFVGIPPIAKPFKVVTIGYRHRRMHGGECEPVVVADEGVGATLGPKMEGIGGCRSQASDDGGRGGGIQALTGADGEVAAHLVFYPNGVGTVPVDPYRGVFLVREPGLWQGTVHHGWTADVGVAAIAAWHDVAECKIVPAVGG